MALIPKKRRRVHKRQYTPIQLQAVESAKSQFKSWRSANGYSRRRIPDELRGSAIALAKSLGRNQASKELGLNPTDLRQWEGLAAPEKREDLKFAEVTICRPSSFLECRIEVIREQTRLALDLKGVNVDQMIALIRGVL